VVGGAQGGRAVRQRTRADRAQVVDASTMNEVCITVEKVASFGRPVASAAGAARGWRTKRHLGGGEGFAAVGQRQPSTLV
jgi:hypothetical protein